MKQNSSLDLNINKLRSKSVGLAKSICKSQFLSADALKNVFTSP